MDRAAAMDRLKKYEGSVPYLYKCTGGEVTVGVGHAIASADDCCRLAWAPPAAADQIRAGFLQVAAAPKGLVASAYEHMSTARMAQANIDQLLSNDAGMFEGLLARALPKFAACPEPAQQALFDMAYNLGIGGLLKFHKLLTAVNAGRWETAAQQCHRTGIGEPRNTETAALFRQCGPGGAA